MMQIIINGITIRDISPHPGSIDSLDILIFGSQLVPKPDAVYIANWLWDIVQRLTSDTLMFNHLIVFKSDVKKPSIIA